MAPKETELDKILIVEPDLKLGDFLCTQLNQRGGYHSILVDSIETAMDALKVESQVSLIITDHNLENTSGFELAFEVRKERYIKAEIIMVSGDPKISVFEAHQVGVAHILQKPVNVDELINVVKKVAGEKRRFDRVYIEPQQHGNITGDVSSHSSRHVDAEISNLGRGGFFYKVKSDADLPPIGQIVDFKLKLGMIPTHDFAGRGIVRWVKRTAKETGAGVEFLIIPEESEKLISAFVDLFKIREFVPAE